jgi:hypothetical protein
MILTLSLLNLNLICSEMVLSALKWALAVFLGTLRINITIPGIETGKYESHSDSTFLFTRCKQEVKLLCASFMKKCRFQWIQEHVTCTPIC